MTSDAQKTSLQLARHAIADGDIGALRNLLAKEPDLVNQTSADNDRVLLHSLCDWPGKRKNAVALGQLLVDAKANVDHRKNHPAREKFNSSGETALHCEFAHLFPSNCKR